MWLNFRCQLTAATCFGMRSTVEGLRSMYLLATCVGLQQAAIKRAMVLAAFHTGKRWLRASSSVQGELHHCSAGCGEPK